MSPPQTRSTIALLKRLLLLAGLTPIFAEPVETIAFASCYKNTRPAPAFEPLQHLKPDVFIWMGDNVYADTEDMTEMRARYQELLDHPAYRTLRANCQVIGTWDDHDYGANDTGKEYPMKAESQQVFLDFLGEPEDSPRRKQKGIHTTHDFGNGQQSVRIILLDTRYHRDTPGEPGGTILGETQWQWLEKQLLSSPAAINLIVSSIQVLPTGHRFEKWANFPKDRHRLLKLLSRVDIPPVLLLSGDRHLGEISLLPDACGYPLFEITSSSLNSSFGGIPNEENSLRIGKNLGLNNFGLLEIDWSTTPPTLTAQIRSEDGTIARSHELQLVRPNEK